MEGGREGGQASWLWVGEWLWWCEQRGSEDQLQTWLSLCSHVAVSCFFQPPRLLSATNPPPPPPPPSPPPLPIYPALPMCKLSSFVFFQTPFRSTHQRACRCLKGRHTFHTPLVLGPARNSHHSTRCNGRKKKKKKRKSTLREQVTLHR